MNVSFLLSCKIGAYIATQKSLHISQHNRIYKCRIRTHNGPWNAKKNHGTVYFFLIKIYSWILYENKILKLNALEKK